MPDLSGLSIAELRRTITSAGLSCDDCIERSDLEARAARALSVLAHAAFLQYYSLEAAHAPPLMVIDVNKPRPFSLDKTFEELQDSIPY